MWLVKEHIRNAGHLPTDTDKTEAKDTAFERQQA